MVHSAAVFSAPLSIYPSRSCSHQYSGAGKEKFLHEGTHRDASPAWAAERQINVAKAIPGHL